MHSHNYWYVKIQEKNKNQSLIIESLNYFVSIELARFTQTMIELARVYTNDIYTLLLRTIVIQ